MLPNPGHEVINSIDSEYINYCLLEFIKIKNDSARILYSLCDFNNYIDNKLGNKLNQHLNKYGICSIL